MSAYLICQSMIFLCGASAIWLVGRKEKWRRWGYIMGLIGQPFWIYVTFTSQQWGIFCMCLFYTYSWGQGVWNYWLFPKPEPIAYSEDYQPHYTDRSIVDKDYKKS